VYIIFLSQNALHYHQRAKWFSGNAEKTHLRAPDASDSARGEFFPLRCLSKRGQFFKQQRVLESIPLPGKDRFNCTLMDQHPGL
jgi:hypothetical protein